MTGARLAAATGAALAAGIVLSAAAQSVSAPSARCQQLMDAFDRYYPRKGEGLRSSGSRLDRDIAEVECQKGRYADGIRILEDALRRNRIPLPPAG